MKVVMLVQKPLQRSYTFAAQSFDTHKITVKPAVEHDHYVLSDEAVAIIGTRSARFRIRDARYLFSKRIPTGVIIGYTDMNGTAHLTLPALETL